MTKNTDHQKTDQKKSREDKLKQDIKYRLSQMKKGNQAVLGEGEPPPSPPSKVLTNLFVYGLMGGILIWLCFQIVSCNPGKRIKYFTPFGPVIENPNR